MPEPDFNDAETRVALALADAGWASVREIAGRTGLTVTRTHSALTYLVARGLASRDSRPSAPFVSCVERRPIRRYTTVSEGSVE